MRGYRPLTLRAFRLPDLPGCTAAPIIFAAAEHGGLRMHLDRRALLALAAGAATQIASAPGTPAAAAAPLPSALGIDATQFGLRAGSADDQSRSLQRALDETARTGTPLVLPPGTYRVGDLKLAKGAHLVGVRGASRLVLTRGPSLISGISAEHVTLAALVLDGAGMPLP